MKLLLLISVLALSGCDTLGEVIREKKYTMQVHETANVKQEFGWNNDHDYLGFMVSGKFGATIHKHEHSLNCEHNIKNNSE